MSVPVKTALIAMVVFGVAACVPPGNLLYVAFSAAFGGLALGQNYVDKGGRFS